MPQVHVTAIHNTPNQRKDATIVWLESISTSQFEVCLKESRKFEGLHRNLTVNWMAYEYNHPSSWGEKLSAQVMFFEDEVPTEETNYALCKIERFMTSFYTPPVVLSTACGNERQRSDDNSMCSMRKSIIVWLEILTRAQIGAATTSRTVFPCHRINLHAFVTAAAHHTKNKSVLLMAGLSGIYAC